MDAPTEWTYGETVDWTSADTLKLCQYEYFLRPIIETIKERCEVSDTAIPSIFSDSFNPLRPVKNYTDIIQSTVTMLIPKFVNHTDNSGNWDGQTDIPNWTEADILTAIGAESRLSISILSVISSEWIFQQRQILDLLKWVKETPSALEIYKRNGATVTDWNNNAWTGTEYDWYGPCAVYTPGNGDNTFVNYVMKFTGSSTIKNSADLYFLPISIGSYWNDLGWTESKYNIIENFSENYVHTSVEYGNRVICGEQSIHAGYMVSASYSARSMILKFDGANGFNFKAA